MKIATDGMVAGNQVQNARQMEKSSHRFEEILTDIKNKESLSADETSPSQPPFQITPVIFDPPGDDTLLQRLDGSLALLESYQVRLGDSAVPVHDLQPDIHRLEGQTNQLQSDLDSLPGDHPIKDLLNRSLVAMTVEIEKYRRGDFT